MIRRLVVLLTLLPATALATPSSVVLVPGAASPAPAAIRLRLDDCPDLDAATIEALVGLELSETPAPAPGAPAPAVSAICADGLVVIEVDDPVTQKSLSRAIDPSASPAPARSRLLALAIVELIHASWTELTFNPEPRVPAASTGAATATSITTRSGRGSLAAMVRALRVRPVRRFRLLGMGASEVFPGDVTRFGGGLRIGWDGRRLGWSLDVVMHHGERDEAAGNVTIDSVSADVAAFYRVLPETPTLRVGLGLRGGVAQLVGTPAMPFDFRGGQVTGPFAGPLGVLSLSAPVGRVIIEATVSGGWLPVSVRAQVDGGSDTRVGGGWLGLRLGVGVML